MKVLLTGGSGRLGQELQPLLPEVVAPSSAELDLTRPGSLVMALATHAPDVVVHAAAYTNVKVAESDRERCWAVNVDGTRNLVRAIGDIPLVYISTDYVFYGDGGGYRETDPVGPVRNYYALSKLAAETVARVAPRHLVVRTSFRPRDWPYPTAFDDLYTSQDYVDVIAPDIALAIRQLEAIPYDTLHIATARKRVFDLARQRSPSVQAGSKAAAGVDLPDDISLDITRWQALRPQLSARETPKNR